MSEANTEGVRFQTVPQQMDEVTTFENGELLMIYCTILEGDQTGGA